MARRCETRILCLMEATIHIDPNADPVLTRFVSASPEQIRYAEELRRKIKERYLNEQHDSAHRGSRFWCVECD